MTDRKRNDAFFHAINPGGTVVFTNAADFESTWEPAQYRRLGDDEIAPIQAHEREAHGENDAAIYAARREQHGHPRHPLSAV